jgi:hypothetical protein
MKYTNILHSKALQNLPKLGYFGLKINHLATLSATTFSVVQLENYSSAAMCVRKRFFGATFECPNPKCRKL